MTRPGPPPASHGVPLGVYVHWPYCARICPYCDFNVYRDRGRAPEQAALVEAIVQDLTTQAALTGPRTLVSVFFGGGTPSLMDPATTARIIERARALFPSDSAPEEFPAGGDLDTARAYGKRLAEVTLRWQG